MRKHLATSIVFLAILGLNGSLIAQKKSGPKGNVPSPLGAVRPNRNHSPKVEKFLDAAERYWGVFHNNLPESAYEFLADNPNTLLDAVLVPGSGWYIQGQYKGLYSDFPNAVVKNQQENGNSLESLAFAPNGGWVMFRAQKELGDRVRTPGAKFLSPYNWDSGQIERRGASWENIPPKLSDEVLRLYGEWTYIDLVRFNSKGEWVIVYHKVGQCGFGFTTSDNIDAGFYKALYGVWEKGWPIRDLAFFGEKGYAIIVNGTGYLAENVPPKVLAALEHHRQKASSGSLRSTRVVSSYNGRYLIFTRDFGWAPNATCDDNYAVNYRLGYPKNPLPLNISDASLPTLTRREPERSPVPTERSDPALAKLIQDTLRSYGMKEAEVEVLRTTPENRTKSDRYFIKVGNVVKREGDLAEIKKRVSQYLFEIAIKKDLIWDFCIKHHIDFDPLKSETCDGKKTVRVQIQ